jgi:hypothetical protein
MARPFTDPKKRFWQKVQKTDSCWLWLGGHDGNGYGLFNETKPMKQWRAHRYMLYIRGELDFSLPVVMHTCDNPGCVNPAHLKCSTIQENNLDKALKKRNTKEYWSDLWGTSRKRR